MKDKKSKWSTDEKVRIVLQTFNSETSMAELCRQHNLQPRTIYTWNEKFLDAGTSSFDCSNMSLLAKRHKKEISSLKRTIGEYAVANDALKKRWRETKNECSISHAGYRRTQQVPAALWSIKKGHGTILQVQETYHLIRKCKTQY